MTLQDFMLETVQRLQALETQVSLLTKLIGGVGITVIGSILSRLFVYRRNKKNGGTNNG